MSALPVPTEVTRFRLAPDPQLVGPLRQRFIEDISNGNLEEESVRGWGIAFNEMVFNAIHHGTGGITNALITVEWSLEDDAITLAVEDPGPGPPDSILLHPSLPVDPLAESGRGIFLLHSFADDLRAFRGRKGFRLELVKRHPGLGRILGIGPEMQQALEELSTCYESLSIFYRLAQNLQENSGLAAFISRALDDFLRLHPFHRVFLLGSTLMPTTVREALANEPWFLHADDAHGSMAHLATIQREQLWDHPDELKLDNTAPVMLRNPHAGCILPVTSVDLRFGSLVALGKEGQKSFSSGSLAILRTLADLCGIACANTHLGKLRDQTQKELGELEIAVEIQKSLLPILPPPLSPRWNVRIDHESSLQVAGDYAMAATDSAGNLVSVIIDVMGKGVSAALLASIFRSAFELSLDKGTAAELLATINRHLCSQLGDLTMFITCALARFIPTENRLDFASAGHCRTLLYSADGGRRFLEPSGPPLGIMPDVSYQSDVIPVEGGERVVFLTDGCYEWDRLSGSEAGWKRFLDLADSFQGKPAADFWIALKQRIHAAAGAVLEDDCTLLTLDLLP